jgi:hypothetical protein
MRLSPYEAGKPAKGVSSNFADFASKQFEDEDEDQDQGEETSVEGYDSLGSALRTRQPVMDGEDDAGQSDFKL